MSKHDPQLCDCPNCAETLRAQLDEAVRLLNEARVCEGLQEWDWPLCQRIDAFLWAAALNKEGKTDG